MTIKKRFVIIGQTERILDTKEVAPLKRLISAALAVCLMASCMIFAAASGTFTDVPADTWYTEAVDFVVEREYFNGISPTQFDPTGSMTRGMFVTVLGRMANVPNETSGRGFISRSSVNLRSEPNTVSKVLAVLTQNSTVRILDKQNDWFHVQAGEKTGYIRSDLMEQLPDAFTDVPGDRFYAPYVQWAAQNGIVSGITPDKFGPDLKITREQICAILRNFSAVYEIPLTEEIDAEVFRDDAVISGWARDAVYILRSMGVINGRDNNDFAPGDGATRAEVAVIMQRFVSAVGEDNLPNVGVPFGAPVPESASVSDSYFADACFIGHSMVVGMSDYFKLPGATYYAVNGISAKGILDYAQFPLEKGKGTLSEALSEKEGQFKKVYILLGTNELGPSSAHSESYATNMGKLIDLVRASQPKATIYVLATYPVSEAKSAKSNSFNRENVLTFNERLLAVSAEKKVYYLDTFSLLADDNGYLPAANCASDGIHITVSQYAVVLKYLKTHTV